MFKFILQPDEQLLKITRQADAVLIKPTVLVLIFIYTPWAFLIKYELYFRFSKALIFWTLIVLFWAIHKYLLWLINVYIITNKRLISVSYKSLVHKLIQETPLDRIHNISSETHGLIRSLFKIGNVIVQIASLTQPLVLINLKYPEKIKDFLWSAHKIS